MLAPAPALAGLRDGKAAAPDGADAAGAGAARETTMWIAARHWVGQRWRGVKDHVARLC
jgi:hypothetical protein